jgi:RND superfamily putative drug exporter
MHLLAPAAWWLPKWLDRILPNVDVEGAALERSHPVHGVATESAPRVRSVPRPSLPARQAPVSK